MDLLKDNWRAYRLRIWDWEFPTGVDSFLGCLLLVIVVGLPVMCALVAVALYRIFV